MVPLSHAQNTSVRFSMIEFRAKNGNKALWLTLGIKPSTEFAAYISIFGLLGRKILGEKYPNFHGEVYPVWIKHELVI